MKSENPETLFPGGGDLLYPELQRHGDPAKYAHVPPSESVAHGLCVPEWNS
jgi:hypothetical protein